MGLIDYTLEGKIDKVKIAVNRIRMLDPVATGLMDEPYYAAYSGGKDSDVIRILLELAGAKHDLMHNHTTVDAPETVHYIRSIPKINISYPDVSMWALIVKNRMPPTRIVRYCCAELKERYGTGRFVVTGVRWAESVRRKNRGSLEIVSLRRSDSVILNADNAESRRLLENCTVKGKRMLNPIIDWSDAEVWEFLRHYGCRSNPLYECGYKRVGCIGCPMARPKHRIRDFERYPKYKANYIRAFERMLTKGAEEGRPCRAWKSGEEVFGWWIADVMSKKSADDLQFAFEFAELLDD